MAHEMGIFEVMYNCRAMRRLKQDPVPEELLVKLIDAANHGPSGSNSQPARWIVVRDGEQKQRLAELNAAAVDAYIQPDSGRASVFPHQSAEQRERQLKAVLWQRHHMHEIPALIIACLKFNAAPSPSKEQAAEVPSGPRSRISCLRHAHSASARRPRRLASRIATQPARFSTCLMTSKRIASFRWVIRWANSVR